MYFFTLIFSTFLIKGIQQKQKVHRSPRFLLTVLNSTESISILFNFRLSSSKIDCRGFFTNDLREKNQMCRYVVQFSRRTSVFSNHLRLQID